MRNANAAARRTLLTIFIGSAVAKLKMEDVVKATLPFYICMLVALLLITFVPAISLALPNLLMP